MLAGLCIFIYLLLIAPVKAGALIAWEDRFPSCALGLRFWGIPYRVRLAGRRDEAGSFHIEATLPGGRGPGRQPLSSPSPGLIRALGGIRGLRGALPLLKSGVRLSGRLQMVLGGENAGLLCCLAGALQAVFALSRRFSLDVQPLFRGRSGFRFLCITETRLGTLLAAALLGALHARTADKKEEASWIIPSET